MHISSRTFKFFNNRSPADVNNDFKPAGHPNTNTKASSNLSNLNDRQETLSYLASSKYLPVFLNSLPVSLKAT